MDKLSDKKIRKTVYDKYNGHCAYCGCELHGKFMIDHLIPRRRWNTTLEKGENKLSNYMPSCGACNTGKNSFEIEDFRRMIFQRTETMKHNSSEYRSLLRFGRIKEINTPIVFYFELFKNE